ncbi:DUF971 domain-containing protein [Aquincola sp. MAHUQ-54]|uniref:DUF971 domain-containing protein n=1 Tax=Aquincola agrisoli TaxID=3119538 RepID=A0AAW9QA98_9BURK
MSTASTWPVNLVLHEASGDLELAWSDGTSGRLPSTVLRQACRCAGCQNARIKGTFAPPDSRLAGLELVSDVGLQLRFDDGHDRGIFPWAYLHGLHAIHSQRASMT